MFSFHDLRGLRPQGRQAQNVPGDEFLVILTGGGKQLTLAVVDEGRRGTLRVARCLSRSALRRHPSCFVGGRQRYQGQLLVRGRAFTAQPGK